MLKWFAPLLLLAGKPELLIRLIVGALAVAVLLGGVWLISNIALTFDTLREPVYCRRLRRGAALFLSRRRNDGVAAPAQPGLDAESHRVKSRSAAAERDRGETRTRAFDKMGSRREARCSGARGAPSPIGGLQYHGDCPAACNAGSARNADRDRTGLCGQDGG